MRIANSELLFNIVFWFLYFLYQWFGLAALSGQYELYLLNACMALPLSFVVSWLTVHVFVKKYYQEGKKLKFWFLQISVSVVLLLCRRYFNYYVIFPRFIIEAQRVPLLSPGKLIVEFVNLYLIVGVYAMFYFVRSWYFEQQRAQKLLHEKTKAELDLLSSQVQPHFMFNTLNNIYSVALTGSADTPKLISHLSNFLSYNLYESKQAMVLLTSEIMYIRNYIELQKNKYGERLDVSINIYDDITDLRIAPFLLLPLVENSFKHGIAESVHEGWIRVDVSRQHKWFSIKIENSVEEKMEPPTADIGNGITIGSTGIPGAHANNAGLGLANVKRRLQLIYGEAAEFKTISEPHSFLAVLKIDA